MNLSQSVLSQSRISNNDLTNSRRYRKTERNNRTKAEPVSTKLANKNGTHLYSLDSQRSIPEASSVDLNDNSTATLALVAHALEKDFANIIYPSGTMPSWRRNILLDARRRLLDSLRPERDDIAVTMPDPEEPTEWSESVESFALIEHHRSTQGAPNAPPALLATTRRAGNLTENSDWR